MAIIKACDVILVGSKCPESLLVVETFENRLQAGTILYKDCHEFVTLPGTYLSKDICKATIEDVWNPERAAKALAGSIFEINSSMFNKYVDIWLVSIENALITNQPFIIND